VCESVASHGTAWEWESSAQLRSDGASWEDEDRGFGLVLTLGDSGLTSAREWPGKREQAGGIES